MPLALMTTRPDGASTSFTKLLFQRGSNPLGTGHPSSADENGYVWLPLLESVNHPWSNDPSLNQSLIFGQLAVLHPELATPERTTMTG